MSEEEVKEEEVAEGEAAEPEKKKKGHRKWPIVVAIIVVVVIVAGAGFMVWHEQPSFCGAICHTPMDEYLATYESEPDTATTDKYGNEVENSSAMLSVVHAQEDVGCIDCHVPTMSEQITEGLEWVMGNYTYPLTERSLEDLVAARGLEDEEEFCLNEDCHDMTRDDLIELTSDLGDYNPHLEQHGDVSCSECHKAHRASVMYCTQCHTDAYVPDGWLTASEEDALETLYTAEE